MPAVQAKRLRLLSAVLLALSAFFVSVACWAQDSSAGTVIPELRRHVTDLSGILAPPQIAQLESRLVQLEQEKGSQVAILLVPTTGSETIEGYALRVAERAKLGRRGIDDGVVVVAAMNDRTMRIEVGYGLEGALNDATAARIIREILVPRFRQNQVFEGLVAATDAIAKIIAGEPLPPPAASNSARGSGAVEFFFPLLILSFILSQPFRLIFGRALGAGVAFTVWSIAGVLLGSLIAGLFFGVIFGLLVLLGSSLPASIGRGRYGGWGGSSGGFGGGSIGWSGGGGSFGGGGASGRW